MTAPSAPLDDSLEEIETNSVYRNEEWWKAVVKYRIADADGAVEQAVYLWHKDDGWKRKNKYVIKSEEAWAEDKPIIEEFLDEGDLTVEDTLDEQYPVSNYYGVAAAETVFQTEEWWKAVVRIGKKGDYETDEVMVYLWQNYDGEWRRRQKFTIKNQGQWEDVSTAIEDTLEMDVPSASTSSGDGRSSELPRPSKQRHTSSADLRAHLSNSLQE